MTAAEMALTRDELEAWFIVNACPDHHIRGGPGHVRALHTAGRILAQHPELARDGLCTYLAGDEDSCLEIARLLLAHGADPLVRQPEHGWNAIELAERRCMPRVAALLRSARA